MRCWTWRGDFDVAWRFLRRREIPRPGAWLWRRETLSTEERRMMEGHQPARRTRRDFLWTAVALPGMLGLVSGGRAKAMAQGQTLPPTPSCAEKDAATPVQMEGPY